MSLACFSSFNIHNHLRSQVLLSPFYRWRNLELSQVLVGEGHSLDLNRACCHLSSHSWSTHHGRHGEGRVWEMARKTWSGTGLCLLAVRLCSGQSYVTFQGLSFLSSQMDIRIFTLQGCCKEKWRCVWRPWHNSDTSPMLDKWWLFSVLLAMIINTVMKNTEQRW